MRSLRYSLTVLVLLGLLRAPAMGQANPKGLPSPSALLKLRPKVAGCRVRFAARPGGHQPPARSRACSTTRSVTWDMLCAMPRGNCCAGL